MRLWTRWLLVGLLGGLCFSSIWAFDLTVKHWGTGTLSYGTNASSFSPSDLAEKLFWFKPDAMTNLNNQPVANWFDSFSGTLYLTNSAGSGVYYRTGLVNAKSGVYCSNGFLTIPSLVFTTNKLTVFAAVSYVNDFVNQSAILSFKTNNNDVASGSLQFFYNRDGGGTIQDYNYNNGLMTGGTTAYLGTNYLFCSVYDGTDQYFYTNSVTVGSTASTGNFTIDSVNLAARSGPSLFNNVYVYEIIAYKQSLPAADRQKVETYLNTKYAIW